MGLNEEMLNASRERLLNAYKALWEDTKEEDAVCSDTI